MIDDAPIRFGDYRPRNFRDHYRGEDSAREALQQSLNVPAVAVLEALGPGLVSGELAAAGVPLRWPSREHKPGLPLALGGTGVSLEGLVTLYPALANGGVVAPLRLREDDAAGKSYPLLGAGASWYLWEALQRAPPPGSEIELYDDGPGPRDTTRRPLHWLVNGRPLTGSKLSRRSVWQPDGAGLVRVSVVDSSGQRASAEVWLRPPARVAEP